jgi:predicted dehydrogenase
MWNRNYLPAVVHARELVEGGSLGELRAAHADFYFAKDAGPTKGTRRPGEPKLDWQAAQIAAHADGSDGGVGREAMGELKIEAVYPLAYLRMLTKREVRRVFARAAAWFHQLYVDNEVEDLATVTLEMEGGLVGTLAIGRIGKASHPDLGEIKLHLVGTKGALVLSEARPEVAVYYRGQPPGEFRHRRIANESDYMLMEDFVKAIDTGGPTILDAQAGRQIAAVVEAALDSAARGTPVEVDQGKR